MQVYLANIPLLIIHLLHINYITIYIYLIFLVTSTLIKIKFTTIRRICTLNYSKFQIGWTTVEFDHSYHSDKVKDTETIRTLHGRAPCRLRLKSKGGKQNLPQDAHGVTHDLLPLAPGTHLDSPTPFKVSISDYSWATTRFLLQESTDNQVGPTFLFLIFPPPGPQHHITEPTPPPASHHDPTRYLPEPTSPCTCGSGPATVPIRRGTYLVSCPIRAM